jgi:threonine dehydrogenase-like Zn-dependent dehydrogenase
MVDAVIEAVGKTETVDLAMAIVGAGRNVNILGAGQNFQVTIPFMAAVNGVTVRANMVTEIARFWPDVVPMLVAAGSTRSGSSPIESRWSTVCSATSG